MGLSEQHTLQYTSLTFQIYESHAIAIPYHTIPDQHTPLPLIESCNSVSDSSQFAPKETLKHSR